MKVAGRSIWLSFTAVQAMKVAGRSIWLSFTAVQAMKVAGGPVWLSAKDRLCHRGEACARLSSHQEK